MVFGVLANALVMVLLLLVVHGPALSLVRESPFVESTLWFLYIAAVVVASFALLGAYGLWLFIFCHQKHQPIRIHPVDIPYREMACQQEHLHRNGLRVVSNRQISCWQATTAVFLFAFGLSFKLFLALSSSQGAAAWLSYAQFSEVDNATVASHLSNFAQDAPVLISTASIRRLWELRACFDPFPSVAPDLSGLSPFGRDASLTELLETGSSSLSILWKVFPRKGLFRTKLYFFMLDAFWRFL